MRLPPQRPTDRVHVMTSGQVGSRVTPIGQPRLSQREFALFQALVYRESGICLSDTKRMLVLGRLAGRLRTLGLTRFEDYYSLVLKDASEKTRMLDAICTNETHFFREKGHYRFLEQTLLPQWLTAAASGRRPRRVRVWSAGCSSGEEPYSLAMTLAHHLGSNWQIEVFASDISHKVLNRAEDGLWPISKSSEIPEHYLKAYMLRGKGAHADLMKAGPYIRSLVRFSQVNLNASHPELHGQFDLVFCCNVLIYFDGESKEQAMNLLVRSLAGGGLLFLGSSEGLLGISHRLRAVAPTIYMAPDSSSFGNGRLAERGSA